MAIQISDIANDLKIIQWFELFDLSKNTQRNYTTYMKDFCNCVDRTPTQLIEESVAEIGKKRPIDCCIVGYMAKFKRHMDEINRAPKAQAVSIACIKSFFKCYDIPLSSSIRSPKKPMPLRENQNFLNRDDIVKLIINAKSLRDRAIILLTASSGLGRQEIRKLRLKDITFDENGIGLIDIRRGKTKVDYFTFCSPEATLSIRNYLDERNRIDKLKVRGENDLLFVTYDNGTIIANNTFSLIFEQLAEQLGFENGDYMIKCRHHALRKYFTSTLDNEGFAHDKVEFLAGHQQDGIDIAYYPQYVEKLKELYIMYLPHLMFEKALNVTPLDTEKLATLEEENKTLKEQLSGFEEKMEKMEVVYNNFMEFANADILAELARRKRQAKMP